MRNTIRRTGLSGLLLGAAICLASLASAQVVAADRTDKPATKPAESKAKPKPPAAKPAEPSLDEALLRDLDNELLDGAGDLKPDPLPTRPAKPSKAASGDAGKPAEKPAPAGDDAAEPLIDGEAILDGEDLGSEAEDPLSRVGRQMRRAEELIERLQSPDKTAKLQQQIVQDLERLAQQLEKQCQQQKPGSGQKSGMQQTAGRKEVMQPGTQQGKEPGKENEGPVKDSTDRLGKNNVQKADMAAMKDLMKDLWGQLPLRDREQMLQSSPEQFLPKYELLIEKYYKRLAEQQKSQRD